jgi:Putative phage tail protein
MGYFAIISAVIEIAITALSMLSRPPVGTTQKLSDLQVTASTYGSPVKVGWGTARIGGNIIWCSQLIQHNEGNGKGGMFGPDVYQYTWTGAVGLCQTDQTGPINDILRIWADTKLVFDKTGATNGTKSLYGEPSGKGGSPSNNGPGPGGSWYNNVGTFRIYTGTQDQMPDPAMEALFGPDQCNANRGQAFVVFDNINLINYGNRVPNFNFEVSFAGGSQPAQLAQAITWDASDTTVGTVDDQFCVLDAGRQRAYFISGGDSSNSGIKVVDLTTRDEIMWADYAQLFQGNGGSLGRYIQPYGATVGTDGYLYLVVGGNNTQPISKIDPDAMIEVASFGTPSSGVTDGPDGLAATDVMIPVSCGGVNMMVCLSNDFGQIALLNVDNMSNGLPVYVTSTALSDAVTYAVGGPTLTTNSASVILLGAPKYADGASATPMNLYQMVVNTLGYTIGENSAVTPAMIDSDWGNISGIAGPMLDQTDGNILLFAESTSSVGTGHSQRYLTKMNPNNGTVLWASFTAQPSDVTSIGTMQTIPASQYLWPQNQIVNGTYAYIDSGDIHDGTNQQILQFETQAGAVSYQLWNGLQVLGGQVWADSTGAILFYGSLTDVMSAQWGGVVVDVAESVAVPMPQIVEDLCEIVGLESTDIDTTAITDLTCQGYILDQQMTAKDAMAPLTLTYTFDGTESDNVLKFVPRGGASIATIPNTDLAIMDKKLNALVNETRIQEVDLPNQISLNFLDPNRDFQASTQYFRRPSNPYPTMFSKNPRTESVPIVLEAATAKQLCETLLYMAWTERVTFKTKLPWKYLIYDPTDVLTLTNTDSSTVVTRTLGINVGDDLSMEVQSVAENAETFAPNSTAYGGLFPQYMILPAGATKLFLLDTPLLRDIDDTGQTSTIMYYAMGGFTNSWPGATLFNSLTGSNYANVGAVTSTVSWGVATNALPAPPRAFSTDHVDTLTIAMTQGGSNLASCTYAEMVNGANGAILFNPQTGILEVIQFQTVVQNADGTYTLSNLLRGRRGTDTMMGSHTVGENFLLLNTTGFGTMPMSLANFNVSEFFEAVTAGTLIENGTAVPFTDTFRTMMPYAPVHLSANTSGSDIDITWQRRTRINGENVDGNTTVPLNEQTEGYSVDIYDGPTVVRTLNVNYGPVPTATPGVTYTSAEYTADFGSEPTSLTLVVYQVSAVVGRGFGQQYNIVVNSGVPTP